MTRSTTRCLIGTALLAALACGREAPTGPDAAPTAVEALRIALPALAPGHRVDTTRVRLHDSVVEGGGPRPTVGKADASVIIFDEHTNVGFAEGHAYAEGSHRYSGQVGRVETTARVTFDGSLLGTQTAVAEESSWLTFKLYKFVTAYAPVRTNHTCGLTVSGRSEHSAWAQLFQLKSAPNWAQAETSTFGGPEAQEDCEKVITKTDPTGRHRESGAVTCTYLVTYDRETLDVVDVELLYCEGYDDNEPFI